MYKCPECGAVFEEPEYTEIYWEDYNGVSSWFDSRHTVTFASCPECNEAIDTEEDTYDEDDVEEADSKIAYYERQGDEYVYYDENECELYREPA